MLAVYCDVECVREKRDRERRDGERWIGLEIDWKLTHVCNDKSDQDESDLVSQVREREREET